MESKPRHCYGSWAGSTPTIASVLTPFTDDNLLVAAQIGITDVVYYNMDFMPDKRGLLEAKTKVESCGLRLAVVEGGPPMDQIVLAKEGRDRQIKYFKECLRNMGECFVLFYNPARAKRPPKGFQVPLLTCFFCHGTGYTLSHLSQGR
eukprot:TRINITY_DN344_c0_g2_i7.p1 TRINITY_DN344_c0_g2~~TRINITY_DN344_c0_g2_i7.p1  ORF type:complete len:148 (-),score=14.64 TRINITY_DN344_c0_g2_i7:14-457(-)